MLLLLFDNRKIDTHYYVAKVACFVEYNNNIFNMQE